MADLYVTADEFREARGDTAATATDEQIEALVAEFEDLAEDEIGVAFTERDAVEFHTPGRYGLVELHHRAVVAVASVTAGGNAVTYELVDRSMGRLRVSSGREVEVAYSHGVALPAGLRRACIDYVERSLVAERSGQARDMISQAFDGGTTRYSTPDRDAGRATGWLDVDQRINYFRDRYRIRVA